MNNLKKVNDNISKDWLDFKEDTISTFANKEDTKHFICFEEIFKRILKNVPVKNRQYVKKQFNLLDKILLIIWDIEMRSIIGMGL